MGSSEKSGDPFLFPLNFLGKNRFTCITLCLQIRKKGVMDKNNGFLEDLFSNGQN